MAKAEYFADLRQLRNQYTVWNQKYWEQIAYAQGNQGEFRDLAQCYITADARVDAEFGVTDSTVAQRERDETYEEFQMAQAGYHASLSVLYQLIWKDLAWIEDYDLRDAAVCHYLSDIGLY